MKIFISWSGETSRKAAEALKDWLRKVIQTADPWISRDIDKGTRWNDDVARELEAARVGIFCLTADNIDAPWINFEAGAISKTKDAYVCTLLFGITPSEVAFPLGQFQATSANREEMLCLLQTINRVLGDTGGRALTDNVLLETFDAWWPRLAAEFASIMKTPPLASHVPQRTERELLEEVVGLVRNQERRLSALEDRIVLSGLNPKGLTGTSAQSAIDRKSSVNVLRKYAFANRARKLMRFATEHPEVAQRLIGDEPIRTEDLNELIDLFKPYQPGPEFINSCIEHLRTLSVTFLSGASGAARKAIQGEVNGEGAEEQPT